jgi:hypothetical protein
MHKIPIVNLVETRWCQSNLRIQKKEDILKIGGFKAVNNHNESLMFSRMMKRIIKKKIGRTTKTSLLIAKHWQRDPNKGYPKGFKNYYTYDPRHN